MVTTVELERRMPCARVFHIVVRKLRHRKQARIVVLFLVDERPKVGFHGAVLAFYLPIGLWMERGREASLDT